MSITTAGPLKEAKQRHNITIFPHFRDRLACDPLNFFCVYANFEFKWDYTIEEAMLGVFELVDTMVETARIAFNAAVDYWEKLPAQTQRVHAVRELLMLPSAPLSSTLLTTFLRKETSWRVASRTSNPSETPSLSQSVIGRSKHHRTPITNVGSRGRRASLPYVSQRSPARDRHEEDEEIMANLLKQWHPPHNAPRCRLILDIVASRKSLGGEPHKSRPYRLGQMVFTHVQKKYPSEVTSTFVGISDSAMTLVGRDILFPYRATASSGGAGNSSARGPNTQSFGGLGSPRGGHGLVRGLTRTNSSGLGDASGAGANSNDPVSGGPVGYSGQLIANLEKMLTGSIPCPRMVTAQPTNVERVDNVRLLVCFPPLGDEEVL
ncbi:uncharacterized protein TEOVI_000844000 [Trypanosoma equiperdum]|uniref:Uncharacterized protein n=2 Tax=Trypanozoon TaxID=39700 RepID=Q582X6_TRYB2|nr:hypothetical protein, conserved [Trypanosoma brucei brucei TREU927]AAX80713.1 hypothetical protein, conserved [Trypanosoma brucei]AAZ10298.1 hypothetical protein, conserved [Trypanosoma brucei brucei TREU927]SCU64608.1 hypothetical protein, conserved [Trypanosoma equiperdum]